MDIKLQENIIKDFGLDTLQENEQKEALLSIGRIIFQSVLMRVTEELDDKGKDEFEKLLSEKSDDEDAIMNFLRSKVSNLDEIVNGEIAKFKQESSEFMKKLKV